MNSASKEDALTRYALIPAILLTAATSLFGAADDCDRACLKTTLDSYLNAITKHDSSAAPLFIGFRQTENAVVTKLATGVWKSVTALGQMQRRYFDPVTGQAAYFGIVEESGTPAVVTVRLKVESKKITERNGSFQEKAIQDSTVPRAGTFSM